SNGSCLMPPSAGESSRPEPRCSRDTRGSTARGACSRRSPRPPVSNLRRLSIVIVTYNSSGHVHDCLRSLVEHPPSLYLEIVVVDNASTDRTPDEIRERWMAVRVLDAGANLGFARANNLGIRQTSGDLILLLNPDTRVQAGAIDTLVAALDAQPEAA